MSMVWDAPLVAATAAALNRRLERARLRAVHLDYDARRVRLHFREATVVFLLHPDEMGLRVLEPVEPGPDARPLASRLLLVEAPPDDRLMVFSLLRARGTPAEASVVVELLGNQGNVLVTEGEACTIRHVLRERSGARTLRPGHPWSRPPASPREGAIDEPGAERWATVLGEAPDDRRRSVLLRTFAWTSALNAPPLLDAGGAFDPAASYALWQDLRAVARGQVAPRPVLLHDGRQPYPTPLPSVASTAAPDLLAAFEAAAAQSPGVAVLVPSTLIRGVERQAERARGRVASLEEEHQGLADPAELRSVGDLLLARFREVPTGADQVTLTDFDGGTRTVALDPTLPPDANARSYYDRAARAERAAERLPALLSEARTRWQALETLLERARAGEASADELRAALPERSDNAGASAEASLPYRRYRSSGGLEIRVGRGARRNDDLTFHHSAPNDVWLHARHTAGAHVILRWQDDGNPPARDLAEAAVLAALASKARTSGSVPVDWTRRKYVRKPRKAPAGAVLPDRVETLFVEPDPALEERLRID